MKSIGSTVISLGILTAFFFCFALPSISFAALPPKPIPGAGGLIPCAGPDCRFGDVIVFANTIIDWLLRIAISIFAVILSYVGFLYITSDGKPANITKGKKVLQTAFWGFIIALTAWIFVNFLSWLFLGEGVDDVLSSAEGSIIQIYELV